MSVFHPIGTSSSHYSRLVKAGVISFPNRLRSGYEIKAGVHLKAVFTPPKIGLKEISRSRFKQYKKPYTHYTNQCFGVFCKFLGDF